MPTAMHRARWPDARWLFAAGVLAVIAATELLLYAMGRPLFCRCGVIRLWTGDAWGPENSQQFTDPYTFTHITHGVLFYCLLRLVAPALSRSARALLAIAVESAWEVIENTAWIINRYRAETLALGYYGDSVLNSTGDILACAIGFVLAARLPARVTAVVVLSLEAVLTFWIRDSLLLEMVMLAHPFDAIKHWQLGG